MGAERSKALLFFPSFFRDIISDILMIFMVGGQMKELGFVVIKRILKAVYTEAECYSGKARVRGNQGCLFWKEELENRFDALTSVSI